MRCPICQQPNPTQACFCMQCGEQLVRSCDACGADLTGRPSSCPSCGRAFDGVSAAPERVPRSYTPRHLVDRILNTRSALEGERKHVTVLFVDIKGSVALADQVDMEEWHRILDGFFRILADGVHRFEGTVNQYTGDGIMALFGAPIAHEDHAQRACHAALELREDLRQYADELRRSNALDFSVRMGLNSGEVVVGKIGDDLRMDYTAKGQAVGLAARVEQLAASGELFVTERTAALVRGFFELEDRGVFDLKGVKQPVRVFALQGRGPLLSRFDLARERGLTRLIGRGDELGVLEEALEAALTGAGRVVSVEGEAGIGKSRLCYEFAQRCRSRGLAVIQAHGVARGRALPFLPILEFMRGYFGIAGGDSAQEARAKITAGLDPGLPDLEERLPLLFDFLGVPDPERPAASMEPDARQHWLFETLREQIHAFSRREPAVILFEDFHWFDEGSRGFLEQIVAVAAETRTLLLVNSRPGFGESWMQRSYCQRVALRSLEPAAAHELVRELLGDDGMVAALGEFVQERTSGNPFFIEEFVRALVESGALEGERGRYRLVRPVDELEIPTTLHDLLAARIDALPEPVRSVLHGAAVLGRRFPESLLAQLEGLPPSELAVALETLEKAELIYAASPAPNASRAFKHSLTQDVAYRSQLAAARQQRHAQVAEILEASASRHPETDALIGHHWKLAGEPLAAARALARAARWASQSDPSQSFRQWGTVRSLVTPLPDSSEKSVLMLRACSRMLNLGWREGLSKREAETLFAEGRDFARKCGDTAREAMLHASYGRVLGTIESADRYLHHALEGVRIAREASNPVMEFLTRCGASQALRHAGRLPEALALIEDLMQQAAPDPDLKVHRLGFSPYLWLLGLRGETLTWMGRLGEASRDLEILTEAAAAGQQVVLIDQARKAWVEIHWIRGDAGPALREAAKGVEIAERRASPYAVAIAYAALGLAQLISRRPSEAASAMEHALATAREHRVALEFEASMLAQLAEAQLQAGHLTRAREIAERACEEARARHARVLECQASLALARVLLKTRSRGATDAAASALAHSLSLVDETGARALEPFVHIELAELAGLRADAETRDTERRYARSLLEAMGASTRAAALR